jgi:hypothetical protein
VADLAASIGLSAALTRHAPSNGHYAASDASASPAGTGAATPSVRLYAPPVTQRHLDRLSPALRAAHHALLASRTDPANTP